MMKWLAAVLVAAAPALSAGQGNSRPLKQYTIEQFLDTTSIGGASFSADESRILFSSNKTGIWNVYTVPIAGGAWTAVTSALRPRGRRSEETPSRRSTRAASSTMPTLASAPDASARAEWL